MPMSDGTHTLKKIAFQVGNKFFRFAINPQNYSHSIPHRTTAIKTKSRIIIEDFQSDIPTITISGTTGFNPTGKKEDRGIEKIKELKAFLERYAAMGGNGNTASEDFIFHNFTNDESYVIHLSPEGVTYTQDVSQPLLYQYEIKFVVLRKATDPADEDITNPEIGNSHPSVGYSLPSYGGTRGSIGSYNPVIPTMPSTGPTPVPSSPNGWTGIGFGGSRSSNSGSGGISGGSGSGSSGGSSGGSYDPASGNPNIYNSGTNGRYTPSNNRLAPINPQAPSPTAYQYGMAGLGYYIGYYGRSY
ncbi:hypothetical protein [Collinsella aerofaciens]|uniref:hypothetical protein n=1 Tax=Collinsella aerofaciens TaxID=74426 RepID=UPI001D02A362|nr:hypothetical protein [Collinsella aerofaciens]MCB5366907.1 hypothetical protein [Collinsella aerofaciens]MCB5368968.1 hypothetical protein [Collinsella aerofaciens]